VRRKLILLVLGLVTVVGGMAAMSAFTAQMVNLQARVEKDIAVEPIICTAPDFGADYTKPCFIDPTGGNYGVTLPQEVYDKEIEVTLSNSFLQQNKFFDLAYDIDWECKQFSDLRDLVNNITGALVPDGFPDCREQGLDDRICAVDTSVPPDGVPDILRHCDPEKLDGNIRGHIIMNPKADSDRCDTDDLGEPTPGPAWDDKKIEYVTTGILNKASRKCRYELKFEAPPCIGGYNPYTDPSGHVPTPIACHKGDLNTDGNVALVDPQDIDEFADLGDEFKIQVFFHSLPPVAGPGIASSEPSLPAGRQ